MTIKTKCCEQVTRGNSYISFQCSRVAQRDGYCAQHHPDTVAARREAVKAEVARRMEAAFRAACRKQGLV